MQRKMEGESHVRTVDSRPCTLFTEELLAMLGRTAGDISPERGAELNGIAGAARAAKGLVTCRAVNLQRTALE